MSGSNCWLVYSNPGAEPPPEGWVGFEPLVLPERFPRGVRGFGSAPGFSPERSEGENRGGKSPPRSGVSILTAMFFARASRGRMAVGRLTAAILSRAKRGEERKAKPELRPWRGDRLERLVMPLLHFLVFVLTQEDILHLLEPHRNRL